MDDQTKDKVERIARAAVEEARLRGWAGADVVKSGFNAAMRRLGVDPRKATDFLQEDAQGYDLRQLGGNYILYFRGDAPTARAPEEDKADRLFQAAGIE